MRQMVYKKGSPCISWAQSTRVADEGKPARTSPQPNSPHSNLTNELKTWMLDNIQKAMMHEGHAYTKVAIEQGPHVWDDPICTKAILTWKLCLHKVYSHMKAHIFTKFTFTWKLQVHEEQQLLILIITWRRTPKVTHESCTPMKTRKTLMLYIRQKHEIFTWTKSAKLANTWEPMITRRQRLHNGWMRGRQTSI